MNASALVVSRFFAPPFCIPAGRRQRRSAELSCFMAKVKPRLRGDSRWLNDT